MFQTYGCGPAIACGSLLSEMIIDRSTEDCLKITQKQLIEALDGVPPDKLHSPALAVGTTRFSRGFRGKVVCRRRWRGEIHSIGGRLPFVNRPKGTATGDT